MRIKFTNEECTRAVLTRGFWWWRRMAEIFESRVSDGGPLEWRYESTRRAVGERVAWNEKSDEYVSTQLRIHAAAMQAREAVHDAKVWRKTR